MMKHPIRLRAVLALLPLVPGVVHANDPYFFNGTECVNSMGQRGWNAVTLFHAYSIPFSKTYGSDDAQKRKSNRGFPMECGDLSGLAFFNQYFHELTLKHSNFKGAKLKGMDFEHYGKSTDFEGSDFSKAEIQDSTFLRANLISAVFDGAKIEYSNFGGANLTGARFRDARLRNPVGKTRMSFASATVKDADFSNAVLTSIDFTGGDFAGADFRGADIDNPTLGQAASLWAAQIDLRTRLPWGLSHEDAVKKYKMILVQ